MARFTTFSKSRDVLATLFWRNPLLRQRLSRSTAYTWWNLILLLLFLASVWLTYVRVRYNWIAADFANHLPEPYLSVERSTLGVQAWQSLVTSRDATAETNMLSFYEIAAVIAQFFIFTVFGGLFFLRATWLLFRVRRQRLFPQHDEIRILPTTPSQNLFALIEWPIWKITIMWAASAVLLLLPMRDWNEFPGNDKMLYHPHINLILLVYTFSNWFLLFGVYRAILALRLGEKALWRRLLRTWIPLLGFVGIGTLFVIEVGGIPLVDLLREFPSAAPLTVIVLTVVLLALPGIRALRASGEFLKRVDG